MRWAWSDTLLKKFTEKYEPIFELLGWEVEISGQVIRHVGGLERSISVAIRNGGITTRNLVITEVVARDDHWIRVASTYNSAGIVRKNLDEWVWKSFYRQCNKLVEGCIRDDLFPKANEVRFSLSSGLELVIDGENITLSLDQLAELPRIASLLNL
jgi:hypothetical protein